MSDPSPRSLAAAARHVRVRRCPGYTASQSPCHPGEEPGGYDVDIGLMCLTTRPVTLEQANHYAHQLRCWVATALDMDRGGVTDALTLPPQVLPVTEASLLKSPSPETLAVLREMVQADGPLCCLMQTDGKGQPVPSGNFVLLSPPDPLPRVQVLTVSYETMLKMERGGFLRRSMETKDRTIDARVLTPYGRACVADAKGLAP